MPFSISINHDKKLLYVLGKDMITGDDFNEYYPSLKAQEGVEECFKALVNLSNEGVSVKDTPMKHIKSLGLKFQRAPVLPKGAKMAITVRSMLAFGFVRLFMASRGERVTIRPFKTIDEALIWLELSIEDIPMVEDRAQ